MKLLTKQKSQYSRIKITKEGLFYIAFTFIIGFTAFNSGNNLIYLIFAILLSLLAASSILAVNNLKNIEVNLKSEEEIYAKKDAFIDVEIKAKDKRKKFFIDIKILDNTFRIEFLDKFLRKKIKVNEKKRGKKTIEYVYLSSSYPFGFLIREKKMKVDFSYLVFPEIKPVKIKKLSSSKEGSLKKDDSSDFFSLEDYQEGMDARKISWKVSAKLDKEKVITKANDKLNELKIALNNSSNIYNTYTFEDAVIKIASLMKLLFDQRITFEFISQNQLLKCNSYQDYIGIMEYLSEAKLEDTSILEDSYDIITERDIEYE